jgi:multidrug efflux pump subunit AcrB
MLYRAGGKKHEMNWVKKFSAWWNNGYNGMARWYRNTLSWTLLHRWVVVVLTFLALFGGIMLFNFIGMDFFPESDENIMRVSLKLPAGTSLKKTDEVMQKSTRWCGPILTSTSSPVFRASAAKVPAPRKAASPSNW